MVCRATTLVQIVCAKELRIRSLITVKTRCQAWIAGLMAKSGRPSVADRLRGWAPRGGYASPMSYLARPRWVREHHITPVLAHDAPALSFPHFASSFTLASVRSSHNSSVQRRRHHCLTQLAPRCSFATLAALS